MTKDIENPETIEIHGLKTIHKLCKFGAENNMEGCTFTEIVERMFLELKKLEGCVVVPESELTNTFYWPDSDYVVDCPFDYDFELDKGEIQVIEKWQRTKSTKIYFANIYKDEESFEITEFQSLEEAQEAVKENNAYLESEEFFNLAEAARGGK